MKHRGLLTVAAIMLLAVLMWGCDKDPVCTGCCYGDCLDPYLPQTSPENVVTNLATSYERREIEKYAVLLDPTFIFEFQQADIPAELPRDYWNRDEDSTGTGALFDASFGAAPEIWSISLDLGAFASEDALRSDAPGARRIRLTHARLEVDQSNGVTYVVQGDIQDMYFRKGSPEAGTDSTKWYLFEWHDQAGEGSLKPTIANSGHAADLAKASPLIEVTTWGRIKANF